MFEFLIEIWTSMDNLEFFYYPAVAALICGIVAVFRSFFGKGIKV